MDNTLEAIYHSEGRLTSSGSSYLYEYTITDHLGNARVSFADLDSDGEVVQAELLQTNHYYPFGMMHEGNQVPQQGAENMYKFNGTEHITDFDLDWNHTLFRTYDNALGRWHQIDPKHSERESPFVGLANNPVIYSDVLGDTTAYYNMKTGEFLGTIYDNRTASAVAVNANIYKLIKAAVDRISETDHGEESHKNYHYTRVVQDYEAKAKELGYYQNLGSWGGINTIVDEDDYVGWETNGSTNCFELSCWQAGKNGVSVLPYKDNDGNLQVIQIYDEYNQEASDDVVQEGLDYINKQLDKNNPVVIGVDYKTDYHKNGDKSTDHFITIVGRGVDQKGAFFSFYENATSQKANVTNTSVNRLYLDNKKLQGESTYNYGYTGTMIRKNKE